MPKKTFYITTPIYYPSGDLHIGHAYTTTLADVLNRYKKLQGYDTLFLTGSDEHGQKIEKKAQEANMTPLEFLEPKIEHFKNLWTQLGIDYDIFMRTTYDYHEKAVQKIFTKLLNEGFIYKGNYEGLYCVSCEEFLTPEQIDENGMCKISNTKPEVIQEDTYFLKTSAFEDYEKDLFATDFLIPAYRRNEMLKNFIEPGLKDLSVTRVSFKWGIPITEDNRHVIYVWLDALSNYITALGYMSDDDSKFQKYWENGDEVVQLVGKEIIRFHSIYWPIMLKALNVRRPDHLLGHGWILSKDTKMSKSLGNVIDPLELIKEFGADGLRFYIAYELPMDKDGNFTIDLFKESFNAHLANNLGNLISRSNNMITKYFDGQISDIQNADQTILDEINKTVDHYVDAMNRYEISEATRAVLDLGQIANKYIEDKAPWNLEKEGKLDELEVVMTTLQRVMGVVSFLMKPILVNTADDMLEQSGFEGIDFNYENIKTFKDIKPKKLGDKKVLFVRLK